MKTADLIKTHQRLGKQAREAGYKEIADLHDVTWKKVVELHNDAATLTRDLNVAQKVINAARKPLTMFAMVHAALPADVGPDDAVPIVARASLLGICADVIGVIGAEEITETPPGVVPS